MTMILPAVFILSLVVASSFGKSPQIHVKFAPDFSGFLAKEVETLLQILNKEGRTSRTFKSLSIDPINVPEISLQQGDGPISLSVSLKNIVINGLTDLNLQSAWNGINNGNLSMVGEATLAKMTLNSDYDMKGKILLLSIAGNGKSKIALKNTSIKCHIDNEVVTEKGKDYLRTKKFSFSMDPQQIDMQFDNLFGANENLGRQMNMILNMNAKELFGEFEPVIAETLGKLLKDVFNKVFAKTPYKNIFPS